MNIITRLRVLSDGLGTLKSTMNDNALLALIIITIASYGAVVNISRDNVAIANFQLELAEKKTDRLIQIAQIHAESQQVIAKEQQALAKEQQTPIEKVTYIDVTTPKYIIRDNDAETESAINKITVNDLTYTSEQNMLMTLAYYIGSEIGFPETIQSLLLQETLAGAYGDRIGDTNLSVGKRSYGVMQMKVATARKVMRRWPTVVQDYFPKRKTLKKVRDEEIIIELIRDDEFNIRMAALNFAMHRQASKNWAQSVVAYNTGQGAANKIIDHKSHAYYTKIVKRLIKEVRPFNLKTELST